MIQAALLAALHVQPLITATPTDRLPPAEAMLSAGRLSEKLHGAGAWLTDTLDAPTTMAPERAEGTGLAATLYGIEASPCPAASDPIDNHAASVLIDHVQSRAVAMESEPCPPVAAKVVGELLRLTEHLSTVGAVSDVVVLLQARDVATPDNASAHAT